jgi:hypothetical protein
MFYYNNAELRQLEMAGSAHYETKPILADVTTLDRQRSYL